ncbi:MAG: FkbM family methyltransferase [Acidimicrobiales bacterium]
MSAAEVSDTDDDMLVAWAQNAEDIVLLRAFAGRHGGHFVDLGAGHPEIGSVTKNLVDRLGWSGVDVEPNPVLVALLRAARPADSVVQAAVGARAGRSTMHFLPNNWGMATLHEGVADDHAAAGWTVEGAEVEVVRLDDLLEAERVTPGFDLLKIDVEGAEAEVLASTDLDRWRPRVLVVEATWPGTSRPTHETWEPGVVAAGYRLCLFDGLNRFYARSGEGALAEALSVPANVFDRYVPARWVAYERELRQSEDWDPR